MKPISPVLPHSDFKEVIYAEHQEPYQPLPAVTIRYSDDTVTVISCWKLSLKERLKVLFSGRLWLEQMTFGQLLQPQLPQVDEPLRDWAKNEAAKSAPPR